MTFPHDPIAAVTHPDPYSYYADLVANKPIYHDETLGLWVASSANAVSAVLTSDICRVRPPAEPVPRMLLGSPAADIFQHLVRMNDGERHGPDPEQFDIFRKDRHIFTFGAGPHICPGETLATMIALAGIEQLIASGVDLEQLARTVIYRPSVNARIALLATKGDA